MTPYTPTYWTFPVWDKESAEFFMIRQKAKEFE